MGSIPDMNNSKPPANLPKIHLDTTLSDLYTSFSPQTNITSTGLRIGFIFTGVNSALDLTPSVPHNSKFLYQDHPFNTLPPAKLVRTASSSLQRSLATKYLSLITQRDAFIAGPASKTAVICFPVDAADPERSRREAEMTISALDETQRPELVFCRGPSEIPDLGKLGVGRVAVKVVLDGLEGLPLTVPLEKTWYLNSKGALAESGLPTPMVEVVEVDGFVGEAKGCCEVCGRDGNAFVPVGCRGERGRWIEEQQIKILEAVKRRGVPFVLKNQQTFGGAGTWVVRNEEDKRELVEMLDGDQGVLRKMLSTVTKANYHLKPGSIIISDIVQNPIGDYGLTFFVTGTGGDVFLGASEQMTDGNNAWIGSTIGYSHQESLREKFWPLVERTAAWLATHGYYGPAGIDVLETEKSGQTASHNGEETAYHIVDLNVRTSGSLCLPFLRSHFTRRGLNYASSFSITFKGCREKFIDMSREDFEAGKMCILSWYQDPKTGNSISDVVTGAVDGKDLQERIKKIRDMTEEVVF